MQHRCASCGLRSCVDNVWGLLTHQLCEQEPLLPRSSTYAEFVLELKAELDSHMLPSRAVVHLFSEESPVHPTCAGHWLVRGSAGS